MSRAQTLREHADKIEKRAFKMIEKAAKLRYRALRYAVAGGGSVGPWNPVETIPRDRKVLVKTVTGMERIAKVVHNAGVVRGRVHCWRCDKGKTGDLQAVAWKEIDA